MDTAHSRFDNTDRILLGACAALWLGALGALVAATVALVDLGRGHPEAADDAGTPWLLYTVIAVSAAVIVAAVPLLLRARRDASEDPEPAVRAAAGAPVGPRGAGAAAEPRRAFGPASDPATERAGPTSARRSGVPAAVDRLWLRCGLSIGCAIGAAALLTGAATYLMAVDMDAAAWGCYGVTGLIIVAMPVIPWWFLRELRELVDADEV